MAVTPTLNQSAIKENMDWIYREKEREFWERAFSAAIPHYSHEDAAWSADKALMEWRKRWVK